MDAGFYYLNRFTSIARVMYDVYVGQYFYPKRIESCKSTSETKKPLVRHYPKQYSITDYFGPVYKPTKIIDNIYVGSAINAASSAIMDEFNFKYVINVTKDVPNYFGDDVKYVNIPIKDDNNDMIDSYLQSVYDKILEFQEEDDGNILIHCFVGASRSVSVAIYYLVKKHNMTVEEALVYIKHRRYLIHPSETLLDSIIKSTKK